MYAQWIVVVTVLAITVNADRAAADTNDDMLADAALFELHSLAEESVKAAQAVKDDDELGCRYADEGIRQAAHGALENMHFMSFAPTDAIETVSRLLRLERSAQSEGCYSDLTGNLLPMTAGQAIMALRWDYAIGSGNWYKIKPNGDIEGENPLHFSRTLEEANYSWVSTRPKNMIFIIVPDWKSEMASGRVDDSSIEYSGNNLRAVEVDYRRSSDDETAEVYFYRTKDDAIAALKESRKRPRYDPRANAEIKVAQSAWRQKLGSLPFLIASRDVGFKLIYFVCKASNKGSQGDAACINSEPKDWSDNLNRPYVWFSDLSECKAASSKIYFSHPMDVKLEANDIFNTDCVPAPEVLGRGVTGYHMVLEISAAAPIADQLSYGSFREDNSTTAAFYRTFAECNEKIADAYGKIERYLKVDKDGRFLVDKTKSITASATCVRAY